MRKCKTCGKQLEKNEKRFCKTCKEFHQYRYPKRQLKKVLKEYDQWKTPRALGVLARCDGFVLDKLIRDLISLGYVVTYQSLIVLEFRSFTYKLLLKSFYTCIFIFNFNDFH